MTTWEDFDLNNQEDLEKRLETYEQGNGLTITPNIEYASLKFTYEDDSRTFTRSCGDAYVRHPTRNNFEKVYHIYRIKKLFSPRYDVVLNGIDPNGNKYERTEDFNKIKVFYFPKTK